MDALDPEFARNLGFISANEQDQLNHSTVAIAGAGGDGGMLAVQLARLGVGEIRLADPDSFELENINRQACSTRQTVGVNKAAVVGDYISNINPDIKVLTYTEGVTTNNVEAFIDGSDLLIDETEFTFHAIGVMLAREARKHKISSLMAMNIGFAGLVTSYHPKGKSFERMLGLSETASLDEVAETKVPLSRWASYLPPYADLDVFKAVASGEKTAPSVAPGVAIAAGTAAVQAMLHLLAEGTNHRPKPVYAPQSIVLDALTGASRRINHPRVSHYKYLAKMVARNVLKVNPKASY